LQNGTDLNSPIARVRDAATRRALTVGHFYKKVHLKVNYFYIYADKYQHYFDSRERTVLVKIVFIVIFIIILLVLSFCILFLFNLHFIFI